MCGELADELNECNKRIEELERWQQEAAELLQEYWYVIKPSKSEYRYRARPYNKAIVDKFNKCDRLLREITVENDYSHK